MYVRLNDCKILSFQEKHVYASNLAPVERSRTTQAVHVDQTTELPTFTSQGTTIAMQPSSQSTATSGVTTLSSAHVNISPITTSMTSAEPSTALQTPTMTPNFTTTGMCVYVCV